MQSSKLDYSDGADISISRTERLFVLRLATLDFEMQPVGIVAEVVLCDQPAVMELHMRAASPGIMLLRHLLQPFLLTPLPVMILENIVTYSPKAVREARALNQKCPICQANQKAGLGDCAPPLGLTRVAVIAITGDPSE